jgi:hypothetical protein
VLWPAPWNSVTRMQPPPPDARALVVPAARLSRWLAGFTERHGEVETTPGDDVVLVTASDGSRAWIDVPFRPLRGDLVEHVERTRRVGVLLARRGGYAAGVFDGDQLVRSKVGSAYVQGTTKAGGWSQHRYARRRANQASAAFAEAADVAAAVLLGEQLGAVVVGGDRAAIAAVLHDPRLAAIADLVTEPWLDVPDPRLRVLQATPEKFTAVRIKIHP